MAYEYTYQCSCGHGGAGLSADQPQDHTHCVGCGEPVEIVLSAPNITVTGPVGRPDLGMTVPPWTPIVCPPDCVRPAKHPRLAG